MTERTRGLVTIDEAQQMLDDIAAELPAPIFAGLNGGILLLPESKESPYSQPPNDLFIMGEYVADHVMGRYIVLYYGSFERVFGAISHAQMRAELAKTLKHELTHHLEESGGDHTLLRRDISELGSYLRRQLAPGRRFRVRRDDADEV